MYDHSYNSSSMGSLLRKGDFKDIPHADRDQFRIDTLKEATQVAHNIFAGSNPVKVFHLRKKTAYRVEGIANDVVVRKLSSNLKKIINKKPKSRSYLVNNLKHFLSEGIPYRIYKLDIKSFYESVSIQYLKEKVLALTNLSPLSKKHFESLMLLYSSIGGSGLPRGMAISAILSDFILANFDNKIYSEDNVYFYGRYVDDIVIITSGKEDGSSFINMIEKELSVLGLSLNNRKKFIHNIPNRLTSKNLETTGLPKLVMSFEYLGYQFSVYDPIKSQFDPKKSFRVVNTNIANSKILKIKMRIIRSFLDFNLTHDQDLLVNRIKFLTSNFSIYDKNTGKKKLSGIFHSYPLLSENASSLRDLDAFLKNAVLSRKGRLFSKTALLSNSNLKRMLLTHSFELGHSKVRFVHFSSLKINEIQKCWKYE